MDETACDTSLGRPERQFWMGLCFTADVFFFSPRFLRDPSTNRPKTLPHDQKLAEFYKLTSKIRGVQHIQNRKDVRTREIPPAFNEKSGELWSTNGLELHVSLDPLNMHFLGGDYIFQPIGVLRPHIFYTR